MADRFHDQPFDEGTLTKLDIFELYTREWLPVFLSQSPPQWAELHLFDFFAGPGADATGQPGSPLRLLRPLAEATGYSAWTQVRVHAHFFDADPTKIEALRSKLKEPGLVPAGIELELQPESFDDAFRRAQPILSRTNAAKLVFIDQFGVGQVADDRFRALTAFPACDFLFFIDVLTLVFRHGVRRQHAEPVLKRLTAARVIECGFRVPHVDGFRKPRPVARPGRH